MFPSSLSVPLVWSRGKGSKRQYMIADIVLLGICTLMQNGRVEDTNHIFCKVFGSTPNVKYSIFCQKKLFTWLLKPCIFWPALIIPSPVLPAESVPQTCTGSSSWLPYHGWKTDLENLCLTVAHRERASKAWLYVLYQTTQGPCQEIWFVDWLKLWFGQGEWGTRTHVQEQSCWVLHLCCSKWVKYVGYACQLHEKVIALLLFKRQRMNLWDWPCFLKKFNQFCLRVSWTKSDELESMQVLYSKGRKVSGLTWLPSQAPHTQICITSYLLGKQNSWVASDNPAGHASRWLEGSSTLLKDS